MNLKSGAVDFFLISGFAYYFSIKKPLDWETPSVRSLCAAQKSRTHTNKTNLQNSNHCAKYTA